MECLKIVRRTRALRFSYLFGTRTLASSANCLDQGKNSGGNRGGNAGGNSKKGTQFAKHSQAFDDEIEGVKISELAFQNKWADSVVITAPPPAWMPSDPVWSHPWMDTPMQGTLRERLQQEEGYPMLDYTQYCALLNASGQTNVLTEEQFQYERARILHLLENLVPDDALDGTEPLLVGMEHPDSIEFGLSHKGIPPVYKDRDGEQHATEAETPIETVILKTWRTTNMKRSGRTRTMNCLAIAGNGNGGAGFAVAKSVESADAQEKAVKRAARSLVPISIKDGHTIFKDTNAKYITTHIYMQHAPRGHGLICHRNIFEIAKLAGIKDLIANVKGSTNPINVVKAAFACFQSQTDDRQAQANSCNQVLLEYMAPHVMPKKVIVPGEGILNKRGVVNRQLTPRDSEKLTIAWFNKFPLTPTEDDFRLTRLVRHGMLVASVMKKRGDSIPEPLQKGLELANASRGDVVKWIMSKPPLVDLSFSRMYAMDEETADNCFDFAEFDDFDDDGVVFFEELSESIQSLRTY